MTDRVAELLEQVEKFRAKLTVAKHENGRDLFG